MARAVKRKRGDDDASDRTCLALSRRDLPVHRDLLRQCYPTVLTLREYVLCKLPASSRLRRRKIAFLGRRQDTGEVEASVAHILDTALVCSSLQQPHSGGAVYQQFLSFSQRGNESYVTLSDGIAASTGLQCEIVDFVIWLLFKREQGSAARPKHLLCDGFRKKFREGDPDGTTIPGICSPHPNSHVAALKQAPWPHLLALLGQSGEKLMLELLVDCSIFLTVDAGLGNYWQLSGVPLSTLELSSNALTHHHDKTRTASRKPSEISLVRSRIFYGKPTLTARGRVQAGYRHIHILNRCSHVPQSIRPGQDLSLKQLNTAQRNEVNTTKVMMYIFPRQFGLHNVFTSKVDIKKTTQKFQDYTLREDGIATLMQGGKNACQGQPPKLPKRLRGAARHLVRRLQILHARCSYIELLRHYCPVFLDSQKSSKTRSKRETSGGGKPGCPRATTGGVPHAPDRPKRCIRSSHTALQPMSLPSKHTSLVDLACSPSHVSAFCQAVLSTVIPNEFWGEGDTMCHNKKIFLRKVDHFIKLRRFESMTLHEISQGLKVAGLAWLRPPGQNGQRLSQTDMDKRHEILHEFLYYVFDSLLIPLIRSNFYVTEANTHRYQVFYFRHDVWRLIAEPAMAELKKNMFEEVNPDEARRVLSSRRLGLGQMRLLPKGDKVRPIMNLRRRDFNKASLGYLRPSINSVLGPVHTVLKFEKDANPRRLGSTLFSVGDMHHRLKQFKVSLGSGKQHLYFAKIDVHAAFDTIPQAAVVKLMATVLSKRPYTITRHAEVRPAERALLQPNKTITSAIKRWLATAQADGPHRPFPERLQSDLGGQRRNTVFIDGVTRQTHESGYLLSLLTEHVEKNLIKLGKKFYRQKTGIPQGSVLSSFLCNYFYADLEMCHLSFLNTPDCLLMRLIDDFLLITTDKSKAVKFVQIMHRGLPDYGVEVNRKKTLINFDMGVNDEAVCKVAEGCAFPYCGTLIDCQSLDIAKNRDRGDGMAISNSLTVEFGRLPGQNFQRKIINAFKIQSHLMFYDTSHSSTSRVLQSLHGAFCETSAKMWAYVRCLPRPQQPSASLIIRVIIRLAEVAFFILSGKSRKMRYPHYACDIQKKQVTAIAYAAFSEVLGQKQTRYGEVLSWLRKQDTRLYHFK